MLTRYSLVKGERIVRYVITTRLHGIQNQRSFHFICELLTLVYALGDVGLTDSLIPSIQLSTRFSPFLSSTMKEPVITIFHSAYFGMFNHFRLLQYLKARRINIH
ncbi:hypothetical protein QL285_038905 [Trifolium repens]|nr:hypothetical protein QL285_038905 [Trifolium repens]